MSNHQYLGRNPSLPGTRQIYFRRPYFGGRPRLTPGDYVSFTEEWNALARNVFATDIRRISLIGRVLKWFRVGSIRNKKLRGVIKLIPLIKKKGRILRNEKFHIYESDLAEGDVILQENTIIVFDEKLSSTSFVPSRKMKFPPASRAVNIRVLGEGMVRHGVIRYYNELTGSGYIVETGKETGNTNSCGGHSLPSNRVKSVYPFRRVFVCTKMSQK